MARKKQPKPSCTEDHQTPQDMLALKCLPQVSEKRKIMNRYPNTRVDPREMHCALNQTNVQSLALEASKTAAQLAVYRLHAQRR